MMADGDRDAVAEHLRCAHRSADTMGARPLRQLIERFARRARIDMGSAGGDEDAFGITPREHEVLRLLVQGATNRLIAEQLFIAEKTASVHVSNIIRKLGVANRGQAAALAHRHGLVDR
jgi:DNA-binding NarL/FixJ family response regulator